MGIAAALSAHGGCVVVVLLATHAMGTRFEFVLCGGDPGELRAVGEEAVRVVQEWHGRLSRFEPGSDTTRLNRDPAARVDGEMRELLELCERVRVESGGAFDVRCGPGGTLDFGAVGKGWALDRAAEVAREAGVESAMLHGGTSSVVAWGEPSGENAPSVARFARDTFPAGAGEGWGVGVRSEGERLRVVLRDGAMGVSAPRGFRGERSESSGVVGRGRLRDDEVGNRHGLPGEAPGEPVARGPVAREESHIVDPRTGREAAGVDTAVVVVPLGVRHACALADAWSTALVVLGERVAGMDGSFESHVHTVSAGWVSHAARSMGAA